MSKDANFDKVSLLLRCLGASGSKTVLDDSYSPQPVSVLGNVVLSNLQSKYGASSLYFDGDATSYVRAPRTTQLQFGTGDFTVEAWIFPTARSTNYPVLFDNGLYNADSFGVYAGHSSGVTTKYQVQLGNTGFPNIQSASSIVYNDWSHIALSRSGTTFRLFINGVLEGYATSSAAYNGNGTGFQVGGSPATSSSFRGYVEQLRVTKGLARYLSSFTPPSGPFLGAGYFAGSVEDETGEGAARLVRAIREDSGALAGEVMSDSGSGEYVLPVYAAVPHTLVAYPASGDDLPALVLRGVYPA